MQRYRRRRGGFIIWFAEVNSRKICLIRLNSEIIGTNWKLIYLWFREKKDQLRAIIVNKPKLLHLWSKTSLCCWQFDGIPDNKNNSGSNLFCIFDSVVHHPVFFYAGLSWSLFVQGDIALCLFVCVFGASRFDRMFWNSKRRLPFWAARKIHLHIHGRNGWSSYYLKFF